MADPDESYPQQAARTRRFTLGEPRNFSVAADGKWLLFLRSASGTDPRTGLWCLDLATGEERAVVDPTAVDAGEDLPPEERARRERVRESAAGVVAYSVDRAGERAVFTLNGRLHLADVGAGTWREMDCAAPAYDPHVDPTGAMVAYVHDGELRALDVESGADRLLAGEPEVSWGLAEHAAAEEMNRFRGFWWAPDGRSLLAARVDESAVTTWWVADPAHPAQPPTAIRYPVAGGANADVSLHVLSLDGRRVDVEWDRARFPYCSRVHWSADRPPLLQVHTRDQRVAQVLAVDVESGSTRVLVEDVDMVWVEPFPGVPAWCGSLLVRVVDRDAVRALVVGDEVVTSSDTYVRGVVDCSVEGIVFTASLGDEPSETHVLRWSASSGEVSRITTAAGVHAASGSAAALVVSSAALDRFGADHVVEPVGHRVRSCVATPVLTPSVRLLRLGASSLPAGLVLPRSHTPGTSLPVLMDPYGGPHAQRVVASRRAWLEPQWLADQGFAVLVVDGRGTPGRDPVWERRVRDDFAGVLDDQVDALHAAADLVPDLDLSRVGIRGWSFGGYLAALAVLRRPDVFHAAVAGAPVVDWSLYDTFYTERYLGLPDEAPDVYARNSLLDDAASLSRPLLLIHGLADDNVVAAHTLLLSQRLTENGRSHSVLPLTGVTHMTPQETVAENLLRVQVEFLRAALSG